MRSYDIHGILEVGVKVSNVCHREKVSRSLSHLLMS